VVLEYVPKYGLRLAEEVQRWGMWIKREAERELGNSTPTTQTVRLLSRISGRVPYSAKVQVADSRSPLLESDHLHSERRRGSHQDRVPGGRLRTRVVHGQEARTLTVGTSRRSSVTCPCCGFTNPRKRVAVQACNNGFGFHLLSVCIRRSGESRTYRDPNEHDRSLSSRRSGT